jgi:predicted HTH domain antitoxin
LRFNGSGAVDRLRALAGTIGSGYTASSDADQLDWRKTMQIAIELPNDFVGMQTEQTIAKEMRSASALALFKAGRVSLTKAAELAGLDIYGFMSLCKDERIEVIDTSRDELLHEMQLVSRASA